MSDPLDFFTSQGWADYQAAGIIGNLYGESGLNPAAVGDGGRAYGIAQWHPDRQQVFKNVFGVPIQGSSLNQQLQFVQYELQHNESAAAKALRGTTNLADATSTFMRKYERPADGSSFGNRLAHAAEVLNKGTGLIKGVKSALGAGVMAALAGNPITAPLALGASLLGIGGKSWIDQFRDWLKESNFWQRIAIGALAILLIIGAIYLLGRGKSK